MSPTPPRSRGGPSSAPSLSSRPPPPLQSDPFDFILEECGCLTPSEEVLLRNAPFLRQEKLNPANLLCNERALTYYIMYHVFGFENAHSPSRRPPYTDADAAELALTDYFQRRAASSMALTGEARAMGGEHEEWRCSIDMVFLPKPST